MEYQPREPKQYEELPELWPRELDPVTPKEL